MNKNIHIQNIYFLLRNLFTHQRSAFNVELKMNRNEGKTNFDFLKQGLESKEYIICYLILA